MVSVWRLLFGGCSGLWISNVQTKTALSTMEVDNIALDHCYREYVSIMDMTKLLS